MLGSLCVRGAHVSGACAPGIEILTLNRRGHCEKRNFLHVFNCALLCLQQAQRSVVPAPGTTGCLVLHKHPGPHTTPPHSHSPRPTPHHPTPPRFTAHVFGSTCLCLQQAKGSMWDFAIAVHVCLVMLGGCRCGSHTHPPHPHPPTGDPSSSCN